MPERIQLRRTKGWRKPKGAVVVARPSKWGNPFFRGPYVAGTPEARAWAAGRYRQWLAGCPVIARVIGPPPSFEDIQAALAGRDLCCWCPIDGHCHADALLEIANEGGLRYA
ncbi:MAG: DUF4326 domain-containing protein [Rhodosalinus sp.]